MSNQRSAISSQPLHPVFLLIADCWLLIALSGCSVLSPTPRRQPDARPPERTVSDDGYRDIVGVMHIHTTYSHDAHGTFEDALRVANAQGLDYLIFTEHNTLQPLRDGKQGWHGAVLVLIGVEISTRDGHYLALNVTEEIDRHTLTTQQIIDEVNRQGGFGFLAHPYFKKARWRDWTVAGYTGIEIYNVAHDTLDENKMRLAFWTIFSPREPFYLSILNRPYDPLAKWDELIARHGQTVGIGASDAHEFHALGLTFAPYADMFRLARTNLLIPESASVDAGTIYQALRQGHAYVSIEVTTEARGFSWFAHDGRRTLGIMGDAVEWAPDVRLTAVLPAVGQMVLYRNGVPIEQAINRMWQIPVTEPGAYRLEVSRHNTPWIFSNPIYVRAPSTS